MVKCSPSRVWLIYVILFAISFAALSVDPLMSQYIYQKIAESYNASSKQGVSACGRNSTKDVDLLVSKKASRWNLYLCIALLIPASVVGVVITSWGDRVGRKLTMAVILFGMMIAQLSFAIIAWFEWPIAVLFVTSIVYGLVGFYTTFFMQGVAYVSDITEPENRGPKFVIIETCLGIGGGIGGIASGYWLASSGYVQPVIFCVALDGISFILIFFLPDSFLLREKLNNEDKAKIKPERKHSFSDSYSRDTTNLQIKETQCLLSNKLEQRDYGSCSEESISDDDTEEERKANLFDLFRTAWDIYNSEYSHCAKCHGLNNENKNVVEERCPHGGGLYPGRVWKIWLYLFAYDLYMFASSGVWQLQTIFFLSSPLCFTPVLVGAQSGLSFALVAVSPLLVLFYQSVLHWSNDAIIMIGLLGYVAGSTVMSFATKPYLVFLASIILGLSNPSRPFIQAQVSRLVSESEQGAALGLLSFSEIINYLLATLVFLTVYPATEQFFNGFAWLFSAACGIISLALILIIIVKSRTSCPSQGGNREPIET